MFHDEADFLRWKAERLFHHTLGSIHILRAVPELFDCAKVWVLVTQDGQFICPYDGTPAQHDDPYTWSSKQTAQRYIGKYDTMYYGIVVKGTFHALRCVADAELLSV